jgi:hypothetical protein
MSSNRKLSPEEFRVVRWMVIVPGLVLGGFHLITFGVGWYFVPQVRPILSLFLWWGLQSLTVAIRTLLVRKGDSPPAVDRYLPWFTGANAGFTGLWLGFHHVPPAFLCVLPAYVLLGNQVRKSLRRPPKKQVSVPLLVVTAAEVAAYFLARWV